MKNPNSFYSFGNEPEPIIEDSEKPLSYAEHMRQMQQENVVEDFLKSNQPADEEISEVHHSSSEAPLPKKPTPEKLRQWEAQEIEDWSFIYSFCTKEQANEIMYSDEYGKIHECGLTMEELMEADALFGDDYDLGGTHKFRGFYSVQERREEIEEERRLLTRESEDFGFIATDEDKQRSALFFLDEKNRGQQIAESIGIIADKYCNAEKTETEVDLFKSIVRTKCAGEQLSKNEKEFLQQDLNPVSERLLYGPKNTSKERAKAIYMGILEHRENFEKSNPDSKARKDYNETLWCAHSAMKDYAKAGKMDLVADARAALEDVIESHFEDIVNLSDRDGFRGTTGDLFLSYSSPYELIERSVKYNLIEKGFIEDPDEIANTIRKRSPFNETEKQRYLSRHAQELIELGVSDETIVGDFVYDPIDFRDPDDDYDGTGARFLEAGVDKNTLLKQVYSTSNFYVDNCKPFQEHNEYPFNGETYVDIFERNGITATEAAQTFSPDYISGENLQKFIERGADAKELMKYMMSYRETFEEGRHVDKNGEEENDFIYRPGIQKIRVRDKNRPKGIIVEKEMMPYANGEFYVAANIDAFSKAGVTAKEIFESMGFAFPQSTMIQAMIESPQFYTGEVLEEAYKHHKKFFENSDFAKKHGMVNNYSNQSEYYAAVVESFESKLKEREHTEMGVIDEIRKDFPNKQ